MARDTIFALSSGQGTSAVAVIRLSGSLSHKIITEITSGALPAMRQLVRRDIVVQDQEVLDQAMVALFPDGHSFTGEEMAEIQCHGSPAIVREICRFLGSYDQCRGAEPGEFTQRAFQAGRMDLTEVEGLSELIAAQTERQRHEAMRLVQGEALQRTEEWRADLIEALALLEVTIDWADEEVPEDVVPSVESLLENLSGQLQAELDLVDHSEKLLYGFEVAIIGPPNVGKSTLLNALAGREAAITSDIPGTTRDVIEVAYDLDGFPVRFLDTAGLRSTDDPIETEGVRRALDRAIGADLRLFLNSPDTTDGGFAQDLWQPEDLTVHTKVDLSDSFNGIGVSAKTGAGLSELTKRISEILEMRHQEFGLFGSERRRVAIEKARTDIATGYANLKSREVEIIAEDLRAALRHLDSVIGRVGIEEVLGEVFSRFCLGK
ncbi:MAG: tRNA uridine-5-carboxymethylaminomethyl(34) synthesis GTPase MnmE [Pseudomonadota bacterium]